MSSANAKAVIAPKTSSGGITALTGDVTASGTGSVAATVDAIQGKPVSATAPSNGQILVYNTGTGWTPASQTTTFSISGDVTGTTAASTVAKIQGTAVSSTAPTSNQVLTYNGTNWAPATPASGGSYSASNPSISSLLAWTIDPVNVNTIYEYTAGTFLATAFIPPTTLNLTTSNLMGLVGYGTNTSGTFQLGIYQCANASTAATFVTGINAQNWSSSSTAYQQSAYLTTSATLTAGTKYYMVVSLSISAFAWITSANTYNYQTNVPLINAFQPTPAVNGALTGRSGYYSTGGGSGLPSTLSISSSNWYQTNYVPYIVLY